MSKKLPIIFDSLPEELRGYFRKPDLTAKYQISFEKTNHMKIDMADETEVVLKFPLVYNKKLVLIEGIIEADGIEVVLSERYTEKVPQNLLFFANGSLPRSPNEYIKNIWGNLAYGNYEDDQVWSDILNKVLLYDFLFTALKKHGGKIHCDDTVARPSARIDASLKMQQKPLETPNNKPFKFFKSPENDVGILRCADDFSQSAMVQMDEKPPEIRSCWICKFKRPKKMPMQISHLVRHSLRHNLSFDAHLLRNLDKITSEAYFSEVRQMFGVLQFLGIEHRDSMANILYCCGNCNNDLDVMGMFVQLWDSRGDCEDDQYFERNGKELPKDYPTGLICYWEFQTFGGEGSIGEVNYKFVDSGFEVKPFLWRVLAKVPLYKKFLKLHKAVSLAALLSKNSIGMDTSSPVLRISTKTSKRDRNSQQGNPSEDISSESSVEKIEKKNRKTRRSSQSGNNFGAPNSFMQIQSEEMRQLRCINSIIRDSFLAAEQDLTGFEF